MAVVKVFSSQGIKTVAMLGNVSEQAYDESVEVVEECVGEQDPEADE